MQCLQTDFLVVGGGSAGCMTALRALELNPSLSVTIFEKSDLLYGGSIARGMDALNIVAIPGRATAELYLEAATIAAQGILDAKPSYIMAKRSYDLLKKLESWGVYFPKDENGDYITLKYHVKGKFQTAMQESELKVMLAQRLLAAGARCVNRVMAIRPLLEDGRMTGVIGLNARTGQMIACKAKATLLATGGLARLTLPNSGYLYGVYDYPGNTGDGWAMALQAGAGLTGMEYTQRVMLIKDTNMPLLAITVTRGGKVLDSQNNLIMEGEVGDINLMTQAFKEGRGPLRIQLSHLPENTIREIEHILFTTERPGNERFFAGRGIDFRKQDIELWPTEFLLCGGHGMAGIRVNERAETCVPGLYAAGDVASVSKQHLTGAFVFGEIAAEQAVEYMASVGEITVPEGDLQKTRLELEKRFSCKGKNIDVRELERKLRRIIGDYLVSPKNAEKFAHWNYWSETFRRDLQNVAVSNGHELSKVYEVENILTCADCVAVAGEFRKESRWGDTHFRSDFPERNDADWKCHVVVKTAPAGLHVEKVKIADLNEEVVL